MCPCNGDDFPHPLSCSVILQYSGHGGRVRVRTNAERAVEICVGCDATSQTHPMFFP